jgi:hypothetical protein
MAGGHSAAERFQDGLRGAGLRGAVRRADRAARGAQ